MADPIVIAVVNLKGGTGKTTTAAYVAHALAERGARVIALDADPQASALDWHELAPWALPISAMPSARLDRDLAGVVGQKYTHVVIDTPPLQTERGIVAAALRAATHVLIPVAPTAIEYRRLSAVREAVAEAAGRRGRPPVIAVLLSRTVAGAASTEVYREAIEADGDRVLRMEVRRRERFAQAHGSPIERAAATAYGDVIAELLEQDSAVTA